MSRQRIHDRALTALSKRLSEQTRRRKFLESRCDQLTHRNDILKREVEESHKEIQNYKEQTSIFEHEA